MSYWTHLTGVIKIRMYTEGEAESIRQKFEEIMKNTTIPFGSEGGVKYQLAFDTDEEGLQSIFIILSANLRDLDFKHNMSPDITSTIEDVEQWIKDLPRLFNFLGGLDTLLVRVYDDYKECRVFYNLDHPDMLEPDIVVEQKLPQPKVLNKDVF